MDNSFVEEVAASLVREFLSRKGLKKTITIMDQELPRSTLSTNNRHELCSVLHLHSLYEQNKAKENPLKTFLEIITDYFLEHHGTSRSISSSFTLSAPQSKSSTSHTAEDRVPRSAVMLNESETQDRNPPASICFKEAQMKDDLELVNVEDEETTGEFSKNLNLPTPRILRAPSGEIDISLAKELKNLLFGSSLCCFNKEWKMQSFTFSNAPQLKYGIVKKKGGPGGVLAAVQACVLQQLLFADSNSNKDPRCLQPSEAHRTKCLAMAIAGILWRAGGNEKAVVALSSRNQQFIPVGKYRADGILETLFLYNVTRYEDLTEFLQQNIHQFETGPCGCILLTVSVILSRSIKLVRDDFDVPTNRLVGPYNYCTQELVNLLLTGKAVSNVFNNVRELDSGNGNITILKGITSRSDIGFLCIFEHYGICQVGCYLKSPKYPIWLVYRESQFSVLFSLEKDLTDYQKRKQRFDLYYYDGLGNQEEEIRLTVDMTQEWTEDKENIFTPPLELCIRTKWQGAVVDWNGTEPIM